MKPETKRDDRRNAILEQWWPGILALVLWVSLLTGSFVIRTCLQPQP